MKKKITKKNWSGRCLSDWILPGEFTFCSRCGEACRYGAEAYLCEDCKFWLAPTDDNAPRDAVIDHTKLRERIAKWVIDE